MSHFGDLRSGKTLKTEVPKPVEEAPRPEEVIADAISEEKDFSEMSKEDLEELMEEYPHLFEELEKVSLDRTGSLNE